VRAALPSLAAGIYLQTGSVGPLPAEVAAVMAQMQEYELAVGRGHVDGFFEFQARMEEARATVAALVTGDPDDVALTHSVTEGINAAINGLDWDAGDGAVATTSEHIGGSGPLFNLRRRRGIDLRLVNIGDGGDTDSVVDAYAAAIDDRTKAIVVSHVSWSTGAVLPVRAIADIAHARGALVVVDGAQGAGAIPIDLAALGADVYAMPGQKWLLGPEGTGAVVVTATARERIAPSFGGYLTFQQPIGPQGPVWWASTRRYEPTGFHRPSVVGFARSVGWMSMFVGLPWIYERGTRMAAWAHDRLSSIDGVTVITPRHAMATLVTFRVAGWGAEQVKDELGARVFAVVRTIPGLDVVRISVGFFNSEDELERFAQCVELLAAHTPETVPARRTLTILGEG
jgi:L-cysteine/cystine lyase